MIKNIIFDWGGVLIHLDKQRCTEAFAKYGVVVSDELTNPYGQRADLMDFEKGLMTVEEFHETVRRIYAPTLSDEQIDEAWSALLLGIPEYKHMNITFGMQILFNHLIENIHILFIKS